MIHTMKDTYPMRINKYLAHKGMTTRVGADLLIKAGKVTINGRLAVLGDKVLETDTVLVKEKNLYKNLVYLAYNKPVGVVSTNPMPGEKSILESTSLPKTVFPVGRLDKDSHGLILLTNDGRVTDRLLNPKYKHEKEYVVEVDQKYSPGFMRHMREGVEIGDYTTAPAEVTRVDDTKFRITLHEGKNRQIRRMTEKLGYHVTDLGRVRIQNIVLGKLNRGSFREIVEQEKEEFLKSIGL